MTEISQETMMFKRAPEKREVADTIKEVYAALEEKGYTFVSAEVEYVPSTTTVIDDEAAAANMEKLIDMLEDNDDVQAVWHNWEMPE